MKVERVYVVCCRADVWFARICVASIRYWHPDVPITLVKDETRRRFDTSEIEKCWNVSSRSVEPQYGGWAMPHFDLLFNAPEKRFMFLDADIVFVGPVLDAIEEAAGDFVVPGYPLKADTQGIDSLRRDYFDLERLREYDPEFEYPGHVFNCGAIVTGRGVFRREDFGDLVSWNPGPKIEMPEIFKMADQGLLNYIAYRRMAKGEITLASVPFMIWSREPAAETISLRGIRDRDMPPKLIHWAGDKGRLLSRNPRTDILRFFEEEYYRPLGCKGRIRRAIRTGILWVHQIRSDMESRRQARIAARAAQAEIAPGPADVEATVAGQSQT